MSEYSNIKLCMYVKMFHQTRYSVFTDIGVINNRLTIVWELHKTMWDAWTCRWEAVYIFILYFRSCSNFVFMALNAEKLPVSGSRTLSTSQKFSRKLGIYKVCFEDNEILVYTVYTIDLDLTTVKLGINVWAVKIMKS